MSFWLINDFLKIFIFKFYYLFLNIWISTTITTAASAEASPIPWWTARFKNISSFSKTSHFNNNSSSTCNNNYNCNSNNVQVHLKVSYVGGQALEMGTDGRLRGQQTTEQKSKTMSIKDLGLTLKKERDDYFLGHLWPHLKWAIFLRHLVSSIKNWLEPDIKLPNQVKLV